MTEIKQYLAYPYNWHNMSPAVVGKVRNLVSDFGGNPDLLSFNVLLSSNPFGLNYDAWRQFRAATVCEFFDGVRLEGADQDVLAHYENYKQTDSMKLTMGGVWNYTDGRKPNRNWFMKHKLSDPLASDGQFEYFDPGIRLLWGWAVEQANQAIDNEGVKAYFLDEGQIQFNLRDKITDPMHPYRRDASLYGEAVLSAYRYMIRRMGCPVTINLAGGYPKAVSSSNWIAAALASVATGGVMLEIADSERTTDWKSLAQSMREYDKDLIIGLRLDEMGNFDWDLHFMYCFYHVDKTYLFITEDKGRQIEASPYWKDYGNPLTNPKHVKGNLWCRYFEKATVEIDLETQTFKVYQHPDRAARQTPIIRTSSRVRLTGGRTVETKEIAPLSGV